MSRECRECRGEIPETEARNSAYCSDPCRRTRQRRENYRYVKLTRSCRRCGGDITGAPSGAVNCQGGPCRAEQMADKKERERIAGGIIKRRMVVEADPRYVRRLLVHGTRLLVEDIPDDLVQLKRAELFLQRRLRNE